MHTHSSNALLRYASISIIIIMPLTKLLLFGTGVAVSSGQFDLTQSGDQVSVNVSQLQAPHNTTGADYLTDMNITVTGGIASIDGSTLCFNTTMEVRDAVNSELPIEPICGKCG